MTLLHIDSCTDRDARVFHGSSPVVWSGVQAQLTGRDGVLHSAIGSATNGSTILALTSSLTTTAVFGCALKWMSVASLSTQVGFNDSAGTQHLSLNFDATNHLTVRRGNSSGTIIATSTQVLTEAVWNYWEFKVLIDDTVGVIQVKVEGVDWINFTGDTRNASVADITSMRWSRPNSAGSDIVIDDLYVLTTAGAAPYNDFLGDVSVNRLLPNNNGAASGLTGSDGNSTDNYLLVDDYDLALADYVDGATAALQDIYQVQDLTSTGLVYAVSVSAHAAKTDAGSRSIKLIDRQTGNRVGSALPLSVTPQEYVQAPTLVDADSGQWTTAKVNSMQVGIEVV